MPSFILQALFFPDVTIQIATSGSPIVVGQDLVLKQNNYTLTCNVTVAEHLCPYTTTYQWTKHNSTVTQLQVGADHESNTLSFSPLRLSDAGQYTCQATVHSFRKNYDITVMESQNVRIQSELSSTIYVICMLFSSTLPFFYMKVGTMSCVVFQSQLLPL